jgi:hypothetical protein
VKKLIALLFVGAFVAATVIGCSSTSAPKTTAPPTSKTAP